jgi:O-antigen/teichoic acid export membrane protein
MISLLFAGTDFASSGGVFAILVLGVVLSAGYRPFLGILLQGGEPGRYTQLTTLVVAGNLAGNLLLIPVFGMRGAAAATAAMLVAEALLVVLYARRLFGVRL